MITLNVARTKYEIDRETKMHTYHLEIIGEDSKGTGKWVVLSVQHPLTLGPLDRMTIEIEE